MPKKLTFANPVVKIPWLFLDLNKEIFEVLIRNGKRKRISEAKTDSQQLR